jgi:hypothetical protein
MEAKGPGKVCRNTEALEAEPWLTGYGWRSGRGRFAAYLSGQGTNT